MPLDLSLMIDNKPPFKNRLKEWRKRRKMTIRQLAEKVGVDHTTISRWENGKSPLTTSDLVTLARILDCSVFHLIFDAHDIAQTDTERAFLVAIRQLDDERREALLKLLPEPSN